MVGGKNDCELVKNATLIFASNKVKANQNYFLYIII